MRSGRLRHKVQIQQRAPGSPRQSSSGQRLDSWQAFANVRAGIRTLLARERQAAEQLQGAIDSELEIRYLAGVVAGMRVVHKSVAYQIHAVDDPERREKRLLLQCSSGVVNV
jgi:SPP1 family predicted phage head-tail adaptor